MFGFVHTPQRSTPTETSPSFQVAKRARVEPKSITEVLPEVSPPTPLASSPVTEVEPFLPTPVPPSIIDAGASSSAPTPLSEPHQSAIQNLGAIMDRASHLEQTTTDFNGIKNEDLSTILTKSLLDIQSALMLVSHVRDRSVEYTSTFSNLRSKLEAVCHEVLDLRHVLGSRDANIALKDEEISTLCSTMELKQQEVTELTLRVTQMEGKLANQLKQSESKKEKLIADMDQLEKDVLIEKEQEVKAARDKAREEYLETAFSCFYLIWKSNKDLNLDFLPKKTRAKEFKECLACETAEAQGGLSDDTPRPS
ncbi:uncharacterized protein LOC133806801 [Humulus lupulus]|uniref:uncharacterized protein LOC133806801 n=1 Tax=Humulus lupulus TaxID=3486 RepID=UPI002B4048C3|nr:uncharacterized protein LOC133806801 [Humulus lupulus]